MSDRYFDEHQELDLTGHQSLHLDFEKYPGVAIAHVLAAGLMEIFGRVFWAALILLFLFAEFSPH